MIEYFWMADRATEMVGAVWTKATKCVPSAAHRDQAFAWIPRDGEIRRTSSKCDQYNALWYDTIAVVQQ